MIKSSIQYLATDKVRDLVEDNNQLLLVLNRFHVPFGFGDKTVCEICEEHDIDCPTFLAIADLISRKTVFDKRYRTFHHVILPQGGSFIYP